MNFRQYLSEESHKVKYFSHILVDPWVGRLQGSRGNSARGFRCRLTASLALWLVETKALFTQSKGWT